MSLNPIRELVVFAVEHIRGGELPAHEKIRLLRTAAACVSSEKESDELLDLANALEDVERRERQLFLNFRRGNGNGHSEPEAPEAPIPNGGPKGPTPAEDVP